MILLFFLLNRSTPASDFLLFFFFPFFLDTFANKQSLLLREGPASSNRGDPVCSARGCLRAMARRRAAARLVGDEMLVWRKGGGRGGARRRRIASAIHV